MWFIEEKYFYIIWFNTEIISFLVENYIFNININNKLINSGRRNTFTFLKVFTFFSPNFLLSFKGFIFFASEKIYFNITFWNKMNMF